MRVFTKIVGAWSIVALTMKAAAKIPCGLALFAVSAWLVWETGADLFFDLVAAWIAYNGGRLVFGSLEGFVSPPQQKNRDTPEVRRPSGSQPDAGRRGSRRPASR
jgi:hypothetical protein